MNNMRSIRKSKHLTMKQLGEAVGMTEATISLYETGKHEPDLNTMIKIADVLNVSVDTLVGRTDYNYQIIPLRHGAVPIVGTIACGTPIMAEQNIDGYADLPEGVRADFALRCRGDSMIPTFHDGDIVLLRQQPDVEDGQIAAVLINGEATLKHVYHEPEGLLLVADNPTFAPIHVKPTGDDYSVIQGRAVGYTRLFK